MSVVFKHRGDAVDYTPGSDVAAGTVVVQGDLLGVTKHDIKAGELGSLHVKGVFDFPKPSGNGSAIAAGTIVFWDVADKVAKADAEAGANKLIGKTVKAAVDADAIVRVKLSQ
jgi:predicted RecA/RadA family phage recombinase